MFRSLRLALGLPLLAADLARRSRRLREHLSRWFYLAVLCIIAGFFWYFAIQERRRLAFGEISGVAVQVLLWIQFIMLTLGAMQAASAAVLEERTRDTLAVLLSTPLSAFAILTGKFLSTLLQAGLYILTALPLFALFMLEGGFAPAQLAAACALTLCLCAWASGLAILGQAACTRAQNRGFAFSLLLVILTISGLFLLASLPAALSATTKIAPPPWLDALWPYLNPALAFFLAVSGLSSFAGEAILPIVACHAGLAALGSGLLLALAAALLRVTARLEKTTLAAAVWQSLFRHRPPRELPRRDWEPGVRPPWSPLLAWRALAWAASFHPRRRSQLLRFAIPLVAVFLPLFLFAGEFAVRYTTLAVETRSLPPLPEHPLLEGGCAYAIDRDSGQTVRVPVGVWSRRSVNESLEALTVFARFGGSILAIAGALLLIFAPLSIARERESNRLAPLLASPLSGFALARGMLWQGLGANAAVFLSIPCVLANGLAAGFFPPLVTALLCAWMLTVGLLYSAVALRLALGVSTLKQAQSRLSWVLLTVCVLLPLALMLLGAGLGILDSPHDDIFIGLTVNASPAVLFGMLMIAAEKHINGSELDMLACAGVWLVIHALLAGLLWRRVGRTLRRLATAN